jgi:hypothetical protein
MTTETTDTTTSTTETTAADTTTETEKEVTLDDVYRDAGLDKIEASADTTTKTETKTDTVKVEVPAIPDPYDTENFKAFMAREAAGKAELQQAVRQVVGHLTAQQQQAVQAATRADIDKAVAAINETVNHPKPKVIEATLDGMVRDDPRLKAIWNNRGKNPGAWSNALKIVTKQIAEDFTVKVDPNLVAAQRARKDAQKQMATTTNKETNSVEERLGAATGADFELGWERLVGRG